LHNLAEVQVELGGCASGLGFVASTIVFAMSDAQFLHVGYAQLIT
jgi:hypothetical protein